MSTRYLEPLQIQVVPALKIQGWRGQVKTKIVNSELYQRAELECRLEGKTMLNIQVIPDPDGTARLQFVAEGIETWTPEKPTEYLVELFLIEDGQVISKQSAYTPFGKPATV